MTEQPDTTEIRHRLSRGMSLRTAGLTIERLSAALDAARRDAAAAREWGEGWRRNYDLMVDDRDRANARIAAALAVYHAGDWPTSGFPVSDRMAHALTEGTGR